MNEKTYHITRYYFKRYNKLCNIKILTDDYNNTKIIKWVLERGLYMGNDYSPIDSLTITEGTTEEKPKATPI